MAENYYPSGFLAGGWNIGIKDQSLDFGVLMSECEASAAGVFTKNNFPGNPVIVGKDHIQSGKARVIIVNSKNANVSNGSEGLHVAYESCRIAALNLGIKKEEVLPSSTGVIGRPMPSEKIYEACNSIKQKITGADYETFAQAICTTDTYKKLVTKKLQSGIIIAGCAKGAGMIHPDMATMLAYLTTDAEINPEDLKRLVTAVADRSFNRISIDGDTSTSDTFIALANGKSGKKIHFSSETQNAFYKLEDAYSFSAIQSIQGMDATSAEFIYEFTIICKELARMIAKDGEGATKLIELRVKEAATAQQALKIARSIITSPLVKTAIYGADPNWGRIVMAVGKVFDEPVNHDKFAIYFGDLPLKNATPDMLKQCSSYLKNKEIIITVVLGMGNFSETMWGCDLTEEYIKVNAYYTT